MKMSETYEAELKESLKRKKELNSFIVQAKEQSLNVDSFLKVVRRYTDIPEITSEIIRSFVERIDVYKPEMVPGTRNRQSASIGISLVPLVFPQKNKNGITYNAVSYAELLKD